MIVRASGASRHPVWRFKPDFERRIILSTHHTGGLKVTDMDTDWILWNLSPQTVRPYAHLEYQDGTAVWDREGNALEVWRTDQPGCQRGEFRRVAVLDHASQTRGFHLSHDNLCVVSTDGKGYVYDGMTRSGTPQLKTEIEIDSGAVGHVYQDAEVVVYSMGPDGYHFYDKSGRRLGILQPKLCTFRSFHINHTSQSTRRRFPGTALSDGGANHCFSQNPTRTRTRPLQIRNGPFPNPGGYGIALAEDEWGAVSLCGSLMVGISRGGRVFVCSDWRANLGDDDKLANHSYMVECDSDGSTFDFGGWLSVRDKRILFEIEGEQVYVLGLDDDNRVVVDNDKRPSFSFPTGCSAREAEPVSFMGIFDDCIMTTYTISSVTRHQLPTKAIRILNFAPDVDGNGEEAAKSAVLLGGGVEPLQSDLDEWTTFLSEEDDMESHIGVDGNIEAEDRDWEDLEDLD